MISRNICQATEEISLMLLINYDVDDVVPTFSILRKNYYYLTYYSLEAVNTINHTYCFDIM